MPRNRRNRSILTRVGRGVRARRDALGMSRRELAQRASLSPRFVAQVESGTGNIAIGRLEALAAALDTTVHELVAERHADPRRERIDRLLSTREPGELDQAITLLETLFQVRAPRAVTLLGIRGAGKSAVGRELAAALGLPFVELDDCIERAAGLPIAEIFATHGEPTFRRLEARCLAAQLGSGDRSVIALPGGVVGNDAAFSLVLEASVSVWLRATPEAYWARVVAQGDPGRITNPDNARALLTELVTGRDPLYARADHQIDTSTLTVTEAAARVAGLVEGTL